LKEKLHPFKEELAKINFLSGEAPELKNEEVEPP
jgi:hypothetical protein